MELKEEVYDYCQQVIRSKKELLLKQMEEFQLAANEETKSSVGDKYETGRAMMQLEKEKVTAQLNQLSSMKKAMDQLKNNQTEGKAGLGSLVKTSRGVFYLSVGLGPLEMGDLKFFALSVVSPIGKLLNGKKAGDSFTFNGTSYTVEEVI